MDKRLKKLFWDSDFKTIDYQKNAPAVIERVLDLGDFEQIKIMFKNYNQGEIKKILRTSRRLTPKSANFWANYFDLPKKEVGCLKQQSNPTQANNWPY